MDDSTPTILVDKYRVAATAETNVTNQYKGLQMHALHGLHESVARHLLTLAPPGKALLDLAAGSGALALRLSDHGYTVTATDIVDENFRLKGIVPFVGADLNSNFSDQFDHKFDIISAVEIIEHVENPRHFFRQCSKLLNSGGILFVSTPNLESPVSKAFFIHLGNFQWFADAEYRSEGHINPVAPWLLRKCALETGFHIMMEDSHGSPYRAVQNWRRIRLLSKLLRALGTTPSNLQGECYLAAFKKGRPS